MLNNKVSYNLDISLLAQKVKSCELMLYPVLIYLFSKALNSSEKRVHTCYQTLNRVWDWCSFQDDFEAFYQLYVSRYLRGEVKSKKSMPQNVFEVLFQAGESESGSDSFLPRICLRAFSEDNLLFDLQNFENPDEVVARFNQECENFYKSF